MALEHTQRTAREVIGVLHRLIPKFGSRQRTICGIERGIAMWITGDRIERIFKSKIPAGITSIGDIAQVVRGIDSMTCVIATL